MKKNTTLIWILRAIIAILFIFSAISKLFPIGAFEKQLVDLGITNWCFAPIFARGIIAFELFLGLSFLQNHFFKKFIIPMTAGLLVVFIIHLSWQIAKTGNSGNCGCMGQLIPMTPLEAIIKNIVSLGIIFYIYINIKGKKNSQHRYPVLIAIVSAGAVFPFFPATCCCDIKSVSPIQYVSPVLDTIATVKTAQDGKETEVKTTKDTVVIKQEPKLKRVASEFSEFTNFSNGKTIDLNVGKNIVCVFNTSCDHCMATAKEITGIRKTNKTAPVYVLFWSELDSKGEELNKEIAAFYKFAGASYPYTMMDMTTFFRKLGKAPSPPRIVVLNEGNIMGDFSSENFTKKAFLKACK